MAPQRDQFSAPGSASYGSGTMTVGDGTWEFSKNTFLLPNLQGVNFDTMRYNGMGNRFATLPQYHRIVLAHGVMGALIFLLLVPVSVMLARFYSREPGYAVVYHAQLHVFSGLMLLAVFILGFFAVGPERNLTNPHHGIGVAIFVLFLLQLVGGRLVRHITKFRSLRITMHQWSGRAIALLGIVQVPLGLTLYGSPKYLFVLYALWMSFLFLVYFILSYRAQGRREIYRGGARSEAGHTRVTESEYFSQAPRHERSKFMNWLGPLAAGAGVWALLRGRNKNKERDPSPSRSRSFISSRGPEVLPSRRGSESYISEKYAEPPRRSSSGFMKILAATAGAVGAGKLVSSMMNRRNDRRDDEYSAVSTETPRQHRSRRREGTTLSEFSSDYTDYPRRPDETQTSLLPPSANPPGGGGPERPVTPQPLHSRGRADYEDSDYSSYVSPSRRVRDDRPGGGLAKGLLGGLGMGWFAKRLAERRARKDEDRFRDEDDMRSGVSGSRFTGDGYPSPSRRNSRRPPPVRRGTGHPGTSALSEMTDLTESSIDTRPVGSSYTAGPTSTHTGTAPPIAPISVPGRGGHSRPRSRSRARSGSVSMPPMPPDPQGVLHSEAESQMSSLDGGPQRRPSERRRRAGERAAAAAAARAGGLAASERDRYGSPSSQPVSVRVKMHDDRDRNVTLRRLTEEEQRATGRPRRRADSDSSASGLESPSYGRGYRRDAGQRSAERSAERRTEAREGQLGPLPPPNPSFAKGPGRNKDSAYYSGQPQPGPSGSSPMAHEIMSSPGSPGTHTTWSQMTPSPSGPGRGSDSVAAEDRRRRRRLERRGAGSVRPSELDMFD
ncbi:Cytochrome b561/ferric reductase transmembrane [Metarhizium album ARSEF 1941]|uniref:Cytochrome b561/ferric reductase transmembrane n=1 Tax=Metarhizium album (strain ARSEF 1941) TaxID=1081103 RepID=A0A0B2X2V5_METAS|nr:Cytochrome b561/ferric reductase transmembrane [Metarhizium album ARSEF 1941]KHO00649.1 Cytochrome b561/ferric reductase transmembrane [Metarhizium album ARSEF 1941]